MANTVASKTSESKSRRPGSITVTVVDSGAMGGVLIDAYVGLYQLDHSSTLTPATFEASHWHPGKHERHAIGRTGGDGRLTFTNLTPGHYVVMYEHYAPDAAGTGLATYAHCVKVGPGCAEAVCFDLPLKATLTDYFTPADPAGCAQTSVGNCMHVSIGFAGDNTAALQPHVTLHLPRGSTLVTGDPYSFTLPLRRPGLQTVAMSLQYARLPGLPGAGTGTGMMLSPGTSGGIGAAGGSGGVGGSAAAGAALTGFPSSSAASYLLSREIDVAPKEPLPIVGNVNVSMTRTETEPTADLRLWAAIRASTESMSFVNYLRFMDQLFCKHDNNVMPKAEKDVYTALLHKRFLPFTDTDAYRVMKAATEAFVIVNCGVFTGDGDINNDPILADLPGYLDRRDLPKPGPELYREDVDGIKMLPYMAIIRRKLPDIAFNQGMHHHHGIGADLCDGFVQEKLSNPCLLELIWSYWHEEGMQVQTMNTITRRFQNVRGPGNPDPLANLEVNPLRPLNNLIWGYIQDEQHRLSVARRNYEYDHHYGLRLDGRAVQNFRPADTRSKFIEGFHHLLRLCTVFYRQDDDTTVKADAFGVLNALKELHLIISQGAHSQFGDLPPTARIEMLMQQWLLARPEFRDFLPTRAMVAYPEPWMDRVDAMKTLQGWTDTSVMHFHNLAVFGEQIVLSIRYGAWSVVFEPTQAFNFARFWRPQVQGYIHAYRAATGVDLSIDARNPVAEATLPSVLLRQRLAQQARSA